MEKIASIQRFKSIEKDEVEDRLRYFDMAQVKEDHEILSSDYSMEDIDVEHQKSKTA